MAHLPLILQPHPSRALVICMGAGNTFRSAVHDVGRVDLVELLPSVVASFPLFYEEEVEILTRPGVRIFFNDGRNYMLLSKDMYDAIIIDASPPIFSAGTVNLYSQEFLTLAKRRLADSGIFALWVPLPCFESDFWMIARNFGAVFPHMMVWSRPEMRTIQGILLMGSSAPFEASKHEIGRQLARLKVQEISPWLTPDVVESGFVLSENELREYAKKFPLVTDDRPYTEFPLSRFMLGQSLQNRADFILKAKLVP